MQVIKNSNFVQIICTSQVAKIVVKNFSSNRNRFAFQMQVIKNFNFVQIVAQFKFQRWVSEELFFKIICTYQFEKFGQELFFVLLAILKHS